MMSREKVPTLARHYQCVFVVGNLVREKRKLFLHKGAWPKFKGYAYSQLP